MGPGIATMGPGLKKKFRAFGAKSPQQQKNRAFGAKKTFGFLFSRFLFFRARRGTRAGGNAEVKINFGRPYACAEIYEMNNKMEGRNL